MNQKVEKPTLQGQRIKTRKRDEKEKYDPGGFRDQVVAGLNETGGNLDAVSKYLDVAGGKLNYRRYAEPLFDVLVAGGLLAPGGYVITEPDNAELSRTPHCMLSCEDEYGALKAHAQVFNKLIRRYKYLERSFEEEMRKLVKFSRGFSPEERAKLAKVTGIFLSQGMISANVLHELLQDHLVKEGIAVKFACDCFGTWLLERDSAYVIQALRKASLDSKLMGLLPIHKRSVDNLHKHFKEAGLDSLIVFQKSQENSAVKKQLQKELADMMSEAGDGDSGSGGVSGAAVKDMIHVVRDKMVKHSIPEHECALLVWVSIMSAQAEWNKKEDLVTEQAVKHLRPYCPLLAAFSTSQRSEQVLMARVQEYCYENMNFMRSFSKIIVLLYKTDVLSEDTIKQWYKQQGSSGQGAKGKSIFIEQMRKFVEWLNSAEEESGEEDDDDDDEEEEEG